MGFPYGIYMDLYGFMIYLEIKVQILIGKYGELW